MHVNQFHKSQEETIPKVALRRSNRFSLSGFGIKILSQLAGEPIRQSAITAELSCNLCMEMCRLLTVAFSRKKYKKCMSISRENARMCCEFWKKSHIGSII